ncbi:MAG: CsgG/HfaB family protein [Candidatus Cloacimonadales bacterium]|nr:CsgG/HfaB family protein [Candidatus Cloacimonadales bacterium]
MMKKSIYISWVLIALLIISCGTTSMLMTVTRPAEVNLKNYKKIALGDIVDAGGSVSRHAQDIADDITTALFDSETFEVLDRQNLQSIMSEHKLSTTGIIDENTASELGKVIGAAVLVFGRIQADKYDEETSKADAWKDKKTGVWHQTHYRKGTYNMSVNLKVIDITTSKILAVKSLSAGYVSSTSADNQWPEEIDKDALYTKCLKNITGQFMRMVAPYDVQVKASFQTDKLLPEVAQAITQLKIGEWEEGLTLFEDATKKTGLEPKVKAKAFYDLGLAQLYGGDFDNAIINFKQAMKLMPSAKIYQNAITNAKSEKEKAEKLQEQQG